MRAIDLDWKITEHTGKRDQRNGNVLFYAYLGQCSRFCIEEVYQVARQPGDFSTLYVLRDASRVTDAQVRAGQRSPVIAHAEDAQALVDHAAALESADAQRRSAA